MGSDLAAFLRARLDEDEAAAKAVARLGYTVDMGGTRLDEKFSHARVRFAAEDGRSRIESDAPAERHFGRHDPARVLREMEAKRAVLAEYEPVAENDGYNGSGEPEYAFGWAEGLGAAVRALAAVYRDHPGYDPGWAP